MLKSVCSIFRSHCWCTTGLTVNLSKVTRRAEGTLETVESFGVGYGQGAGTSTGDWMKPPGDLFLYCDMKDLGADMVFISVQSYFSPFKLPFKFHFSSVRHELPNIANL